MRQTPTSWQRELPQRVAVGAAAAAASPRDQFRQHRTSRESGDRNASWERSPSSANRSRHLRGWDDLCESGPWAGGKSRCAHGYMLLPLSRPRTIWKDTGSHHLNGWRGQEALPLPTFLSCIMSSEAQDEFIEAAPEPGSPSLFRPR